MQTITPTDIAAPLGHYSHAILVPAGTDTLHIAGQVGAAADGTVPEAFEAQARLCWENLLAVLCAAGMGVESLVKTTVYLTSAADLPAFAAVRNGYLGSHKPASTLIVAAALARPEWKVEIDAVAARPGVV